MRLHSLLWDSFCSSLLEQQPRPPEHFHLWASPCLPSFTAASGINLHHTLYHEAKLRTAAAQPDKSTKTSGPTLNTTIGVEAHPYIAEQHIWDDAVGYYAVNYAAKDLLFSSELIQLKDQLGDFEDCE